MNELPLITVITVTYNAEKYIEKTIHSIINLDYPFIEYIIIDGGSNDKTIEIIKKYISFVSYFISEKDNGIYDAMNKGIAVSNGEWINFMNAGDEFASSDVISYLVDHLEPDTTVIAGNRYIIYDHTNERKFQKAPQIDGIKEFGMPSGHQSMLIKSTVMKKLQYSTQYKYASDHDLMHRIYADHYKFKFVDKAISCYLRGGYSDQNNFDACIEILFLQSKYNPSEKPIESLGIYKYIYSNFKPNGLNFDYSFSLYLNVMYEQALNISKLHDNIVLYGNGIVTKCLLHLFNDKTIIVDINATENEQFNATPIYHSSYLSKIKFDKIIITVLGRAEEIKYKLLEDYNINNDKVIILSPTSHTSK